MSQTSGTNNSDLLVGTLAPFLTALPFVVMRVYTTCFILRRWTWADTFLMVSVIFALVFTGFKIETAQIYVKGPRGNILFGNVLLIYKILGLVTFPCHVISTTLAKASVAAYLLSFVSTRTMKLLVYLTLGVMATYSVGVIGFSIACTVTVRDVRDVLFGSKNPICAYAVEGYIVGGFLNTFTDLVLLLLPIWILKPLQMKWSRKLAILPILMTGGFVMVTSIVRLSFSWRLRTGSSVQNWKESGTWNNLEIWVGIICCCLPSLKPFFRQMARRTNSDVSHNRPKILVTNTLTTVVTGAPSHFQSQGASFAMHSVGVEETRRYTGLKVTTEDKSALAARTSMEKIKEAQSGPMTREDAYAQYVALDRMIGQAISSKTDDAASQSEHADSRQGGCPHDSALSLGHGSVMASCSRTAVPTWPLQGFPQSKEY
ncbi:hypothetical protein MAPG_10153 [Magnaporthiopsis poae ATCC 64411]|uniref:Rhodopsin domain-containing protein n=1 Tax=Magnaporthiopsis poae (strain ATCC 64411 / 73-15) TaxID=644358 RepID=A0A0C4EBU4_MAGP6|nr:hypothetical protein MAPG_10153 [Magnaporthiopsis poae ATCC 64411]